MHKRWSSYPSKVLVYLLVNARDFVMHVCIAKTAVRRLYEAALLLALMMQRACADCEVWLFAESNVRLQVDPSLGPIDKLKLVEKKYWVGCEMSDWTFLSLHVQDRLKSTLIYREMDVEAYMR